ncbi:hypothetical protein RI065_03645 [Mycoplasmatota bacterium zrk1]
MEKYIDRLNVGFMLNHEYFIPHAELLINSIKSDVKFYVLVPSTINKDNIESNLSNEKVEIIVFDFDESLSKFPFADKVFAAAHAESIASDYLLWMDVDSIFLRDITEIEVGDFDINIRPVDKKNIGIEYSLELNDLWKDLYNYFGLEDNFDSLVTGIDNLTIRPYYNAGFMILKTEKSILRKWKDAFSELCLSKPVEKYYDESYLYKIFIHQAVLACVIMKYVDKKKINILPDNINFPVHLYDEHSQKMELDLDSIICCRYDTYFNKESQNFIFQDEIEALIDKEKHKLIWTY